MESLLQDVAYELPAETRCGIWSASRSCSHLVSSTNRYYKTISRLLKVTTAMRFHGLMLVRDEVDIIEQNLESVLSWIDSVHVFDSGSTDGTWEAILSYASKDQRVRPLGRQTVVFTQALRAFMFNEIRQGFEDGDWIVKLDADEFYHIPPPEFVRRFLQPRETCVYLQWYFFRLTTQELQRYASGTISILEDRSRPIEERRRFYKITDHSEPRMFKYRRTMKWSHKCGFPYHAGFVAKNRIPIRHYPHRDPEQMMSRYALRASMKRNGAPSGAHWDTDDWRQDVIQYRGDLETAQEQSLKAGLSAVKGHTSGELHYWTPGAALPVVRNTDHLKQAGYRLLQYGLHSFFLPIVDRLYKGFDGGSGLVGSLSNIEDLSASKSGRTA